MEEKVNFTPGRSATNNQVIKKLRFGFVGYLEKVLKRHKTRTQHVKLQLPTPAIELLVAVKALKLQNFSIVEV